MALFTQKGNALEYRYINEVVRIEPWGKGLRMRAVKAAAFSQNDWALIAAENETPSITIEENRASIKNGDTVAKMDSAGQVVFENVAGKTLLKERWKVFRGELNEHSVLGIPAREYHLLEGGRCRLRYRLHADPDERIYGMGQYQEDILNWKNSSIELSQRNSQASVPFYYSSLGYGFLWNNPAVGSVHFARNQTEWTAEVTAQLDIWITAGDNPASVLRDYSEVTGRVPMMPEDAMGFWQCRLRYRTQEELLEVAREFRRRSIPLSVIVIDFYHWTKQGEWEFDPRYWPDPKAMVQELQEMGVELMVSIWPTVETASKNYSEMREAGFLIETRRGVPLTGIATGLNVTSYDTTNPEARAYVWKKIEDSYFGYGIKRFWLDAAEPEFDQKDDAQYLYHLGAAQEVGNLYPFHYAQTFYEGLQKRGVQNPVSLIRCAWAGVQRYGALVWSGDILTDFDALKKQIPAGLSMGIAGIPWWTTDIGGFHGGKNDDPAYRELITRWFEWGTFCPVMRLHGFRDGWTEVPEGEVMSGGPNEVWSYGEEVCEIMVAHIRTRERMRPYIRQIMAQAHETGAPVMRPLFYDFHRDENCWSVEDQYMFGPDVLVAPITQAGQRMRAVYLPAGTIWTDARTGTVYEGGQTIEAEAPITSIPVFVREGAAVRIFE